MKPHHLAALCLLAGSVAACYDDGPILMDPVEVPSSDTPNPLERPKDDPTDRPDDTPDPGDDPVETPPIVPQEGGGGVAWVELRWASAERPNNVNLDLHVVDPNGSHIFYLNTTAADDSGWFAHHPECISFDCNGSENSPSERIEWDLDRMPHGQYEVWVENDGNRAAAFELEINVPGSEAAESHTVDPGTSSSTWVFLWEGDEPEPSEELPTDCLEKLTALGIKHTPTTISEGNCKVEDAVIITGPVNGITYRYDPVRSTTKLRTSCEIALKLYESAPLMKGHDIDTVYHKGSYACRNKRTVRGLSQHAFARAMDYSGFRTKGGTEYSVVRHWQHRTNNPTTEAARVLRDIAKGLETYYPIVLDADYDRNHDDHFHAALRGR